MKRRFMFAAATLVLPLMGADVSGEWNLKGDASGITIDVNCSFKQDGNTLSGICKGGNRPDREVSGAIEDGKVRFQYSVDFSGRAVKLVYSGAVQENSIKGTITAQGVAAGEFTGTKK